MENTSLLGGVYCHQRHPVFFLVVSQFLVHLCCQGMLSFPEGQSADFSVHATNHQEHVSEHPPQESLLARVQSPLVKHQYQLARR